MTSSMDSDLSRLDDARLGSELLEAARRIGLTEPYSVKPDRLGDRSDDALRSDAGRAPSIPDGKS